MIPFISSQYQLEEKIAEWRSKAGASMRVDDMTAYSGHRLYAITLSDFSVDASRKKTLYVTQPHAHEPGTTAGMADMIEQLVTGRDLSGQPCRFDRERVLADTIITLNPIGNPFGREHAPYPYYDGTQITPEQFRCLIFGEDPENPGVQWKRVDLWDKREERHVPDPLGIVYEPIDEYRYVEPNRSKLSSYFKLFYKMDAVYRYHYWLDLHQMMFVDSQLRDTGYSCQIFLPLTDIVPESRVAENAAWAADITDSWLKAGYAAKPPISTPYSGVQADYFRQNYTELHKRMHRISTEVINNRPHVPVEVQVKAQSLAIEATLLWLSGHAAAH